MRASTHLSKQPRLRQLPVAHDGHRGSSIPCQSRMSEKDVDAVSPPAPGRESGHHPRIRRHPSKPKCRELETELSARRPPITGRTLTGTEAIAPSGVTKKISLPSALHRGAVPPDFDTVTLSPSLSALVARAQRCGPLLPDDPTRWTRTRATGPSGENCALLLVLGAADQWLCACWSPVNGNAHVSIGSTRWSRSYTAGTCHRENCWSESCAPGFEGAGVLPVRR